MKPQKNQVKKSRRNKTMSKEQLAIRKEQRAGDNEQLAKSKGRAIFQEFAICYYSLFDFSVFVDAI